MRLLLAFLLACALLSGGSPARAEGLKVVVTDNEGACTEDTRAQDIERLRARQLGLAKEMLAVLANMEKAGNGAAGQKELGKEIARLRAQAVRIVKELEAMAPAAKGGK